MGAAETTTYRVETVYDVTDRASRALGEIDKRAGGAAESSEKLSAVLGGMGTAIVGAIGVGAAKSAFIDFNARVQDTKAQIAGMLALASKSTLADNLSRADQLYGNLQKRAASLPGTTEEYVAMAGMITQPIINAGLKMKDLEDITVNTVVAAKALGVEAGAAARDVDQALRGQFHSTDVFTGKLLGSMGYLGETGRAKFNAMDSVKRAGELKKAIMQSQITDMAAMQGASFTGVMSTLEDSFQQLGGRIGLPLFTAVSKEIGNWNTWLEKNSVKVDHIVDSVSKGLVTGFEMAKSAVKWIVDHSDVLLSIGKVWAGTKIMGAIGGGIGGSLGSLGGMAASLGGSASGGSIGGLLAVGTASYLVTTELMKLSGASDSLERLINPMGYKYRKLTESMAAWDDALAQSRADLQGKGQTGATATNSYANALGAVEVIKREMEAVSDANRITMAAAPWMRGKGNMGGKPFNDAKARLMAGGFDDATAEKYATNSTGVMAKLQSELVNTQQRAYVAADITQKRIDEVMSSIGADKAQTVDLKKSTQIVMELMMRNLAAGKDPLNFPEVRDIMLGANNVLGKDPFSQAKPSTTNIKIDRVEVKATDPDRWIADLDAKAKSHLQAPRQARAAQRR